MRFVLVVLLTLGIIGGVASGIRYHRYGYAGGYGSAYGCHGGGWHGGGGYAERAEFERRVADVCTDAALRAVHQNPSLGIPAPVGPASAAPAPGNPPNPR